jgi:hypothetical protein
MFVRLGKSAIGGKWVSCDGEAALTRARFRGLCKGRGAPALRAAVPVVPLPVKSYGDNICQEPSAPVSGLRAVLGRNVFETPGECDRAM